MLSKLFTTVLEYARKELDWSPKWINSDDKNFTNLRFADDIMLISENIREAEEMLHDLISVTEKV